MPKTIKMRVIKTVAAIILMLAIMATTAGGFGGNSFLADTTQVYKNILVQDASDTTQNLSAEHLKGQQTHSFLTSDDVVTAIIELNEPSLIDAYNSGVQTDTFSQFMTTNAAKNRENLLKASQSTIINSLIKDYNITPNLSYTAILNGFSATLKYGDVASLKQNAYVKSISISEVYRPEEAQPVENEINADTTGIYNFSQLKTVDGQPLDGSGLLVAVIDEGFDLSHEAFDFSVPNPVLDTFAVDSLLPQISASQMSQFDAKDVYRTSKIPFAYNYADATYAVQPGEGHGTHVAGIATGLSGTIRGVAPMAQLACMQVFSTIDGSSDDSIILSALSDAVVLGADVVNMSLGMALGFSDEEDSIINEVYERVRTSGVSLSVSAGNDYASSYGSTVGDTALASDPDTGTISYPASYESVMAVASISAEKSNFLTADNTYVMYQLSAMVDNVMTDFIAEILTDKGDEFTFDYIKVGKGTAEEFSTASLSGKIAVVERGAETYENMAIFAAERGAAGLVIYNNTYGHAGARLRTGGILPVCTITQADGNLLKQSGTIKVARQAAAGPFMSDFSSRGVLPDLILKPDITAPGESILSAMPQNNYELMSGTSMAAPNIAGAMVLLRQYLSSKYPTYTKQQIYDLTSKMLMSTATIMQDRFGNPYTPRRQGAGLANLNNATAANAYLYVDGTDKTKLSLGDDKEKTGVYQLQFNIENISSSAKSFRVDVDTFTETLSADGITIEERAYVLSKSVSLSASGNAVANSSNSLSVLGYGSGTITLTISLSAQSKAYLNQSFVNGMYVEGFVRLSPHDTLPDGTIDGSQLSIPYVAFYGDWTAAPIFDNDIYSVADGQQSSGTPLAPGSYYYVSDESIAQSPLGEFSYNLIDASKTPATSMQKAAISGASYFASDYTNSAIRGNFMLSEIEGGLLRNVKTVDYQISDAATGNTLYSSTVAPYVGKSFYPGYRQESRIYIGATAGVITGATSLQLPSNTSYVFEMSARLDYDGVQNNLNNSYSFEFFVDSQPPRLNADALQLRSITKGGKTRYFLDMDVYENHYLEMMTIATYSGRDIYGNYSRFELLQDDYVVPLNTDRNTTTTISYELTDYMDTIEFNGGNIVLQLSDYAKNIATYNIRLNDFAPQEIAFVSNEITIDSGETVDLKDYLATDSTWTSGMKWTSSSDNVVVSDGEVFGVAQTTQPAIITVTNHLNKSATILINVSATTASQTVTSLKMFYSVEKSNIIAPEVMHQELMRGDSGVFTLQAYPFKASMGDIVWIYDTDYITIIPTGPLTARYFVKAALPTQSMTTTITAQISGTNVSVSKTFILMEEYSMAGTMITSYNGYGDENGRLVIPASLNATVIGGGAFAYNIYLTDVTIPEGIDSISYSAFLACGNLTNVNLPVSLHTIGSYAFTENYKLTTINLQNVRYIDAYAFSTCSSLLKADIRNTWFLGEEAFSSCESLREVDISNVSHMGGYVFTYCESLISIKTTKTTVIGLAAFASTAIEHLVLYASSIGEGAFTGCTYLKSVVIVNDVKEIGGGAFQNCTSLATITFNGRASSIGASAFQQTALTSVTLPDGINHIGDNAFYGSAYLTQVTIPSSAHITRVGTTPFMGTAVTGFTLQSGNPYHSIGTGKEGAIDLYDAGYLYDQDKSTLIMTTSDNKGTIYRAPSSLRTFGFGCFSGNEAISTVILPDNREIKIEDYAFSYSKVSTLSVADNGHANIYHIGEFAFVATPISRLPSYSPSLRKLEYLGHYAFMQSSLSSFNVDTSQLSFLGYGVFYYCASLTTINLKDAPITVLNPQMFESSGISNITLPDTLHTIGQQAFAYCASLSQITFPSSLQMIGQAAFAASAIRALYLPASVTDIYYSAFYGCQNLTDIYTVLQDETVVEGMPEVLRIYNAAFYMTKITKIKADKLIYTGNSIVSMATVANDTLTEIYAPNLQHVEERAFINATALKTVNVAAAASVGERAFYGCTSLQQIDLSSAVTIAAEAFYGCTSLKTISLSSAESIGKQAFKDSGITTITIPKVQSISTRAFEGTAITTLALGASLKSLFDGALSGLKSLTSYTVDPQNPYFEIHDDVLYRLVEGGYQLVFYPLFKTDSQYVIKDFTLRIAENAFANNAHLQKVTLPQSLLSIGSGAFNNCANLNEVVFLSVDAPLLESRFDKEYEDTFNNFGAFGKKTLLATIPSVSSGYDSYIYVTYFGNLFADNPEFAPMLAPQITITHIHHQEGITHHGNHSPVSPHTTVLIVCTLAALIAALIIFVAVSKRRNNNEK